MIDFASEWRPVANLCYWETRIAGYRVTIRNRMGRWIGGSGPTLCEAMWNAYEQLRLTSRERLA